MVQTNVKPNRAVYHLERHSTFDETYDRTNRFLNGLRKFLEAQSGSQGAEPSHLDETGEGESGEFDRSLIATQKLLDGAIAAAVKATPLSPQSPPLTPIRWVWGLASAYHLTHSVPPLMEEAAQRFATVDRQNLVQWAMQKSKEERGRDQLALLDIQAMGYKPEAVVDSLIPVAAVNLIRYLTQNVRSANPIGCVGYSYTMERLAVGIKQHHIQSVESLLPPNIYATRCLQMHSSVGADTKHVEETVEIVAGLPPEERLDIAIACYETTLLWLSSPAEDEISEAELQRVLQPLKLHSVGKADS